MQRLVERVRVRARTLHNLPTMDIYQRLGGLSEVMAVNHKGSPCVPGPSQRRTAGRVGVSRAMVNRLRQDLASGGCTEIGCGCIVLLHASPARWSAP